MNYIGLDAHSKTCTFVVLNKKGEETNKATVETSEKNLVNFLSTLKGKKKLVFEESSISQWLYLLLKDQVDELTVCNAYYLAKKQGAKNDYREALHLGNELRCNHLVPVFHEDSYLIKLRTLFSNYSDVTQDCTRAKNRYKAVLRSKGIKTKLQKINDIDDAEKELKNPEDQFVAKSLYRQIEMLETEKSDYKKLFVEYEKKYQVIKNLTSIPGISTIRAIAISSYTCSPERFQNKHKYWSYTMLVRHIEESDGRVYGLKTKYGRMELKNVFMGAAIRNLMSDNALKRHYDRLRSKGIEHKKARKAVARRIAAIALQIMKTGVKYDEGYLEKKLKKTKD
jgi:transposase